MQRIYETLLRNLLTFRYVTTSNGPKKFFFDKYFSNANTNILQNICSDALLQFKHDPVFVKLTDESKTVIVIGDLHGQIHDLQRILYEVKIQPSKNYLFLGDLVDRGSWGIEVAMVVFLMKILYPANVFVIRGNHECPIINREYGFQTECIQTFGQQRGTQLWADINSVFQYLPLCAMIIKGENRVFCTHGGISPQLKSLDELDRIDRSTLMTIPDEDIVCDLTWADPEECSTDCGYDANERGCSVIFNSKCAEKFCRDFDVKFICRAHQMVDRGYEFFGPQKKLVTVFSASNYCGDCENAGAVLSINPDCVGVFITFKSIPNIADESLILPFMTSDASSFYTNLQSGEESVPSSVFASTTNEMQQPSTISRKNSHSPWASAAAFANDNHTHGRQRRPKSPTVFSSSSSYKSSFSQKQNANVAKRSSSAPGGHGRRQGQGQGQGQESNQKDSIKVVHIC